MRMRTETGRTGKDRLPATMIWSLILAGFLALAIPAAPVSAQVDRRAVVRQAIQSYYSLRRLGLLEFKANVQPNWTLIVKGSVANPEAMKMLNGLMFSVSLKPDGSVNVEHESGTPIPAVQEENVKQIYAGMDQTLTGFFATWNLFMLTSPFPDVDSEYQLQDWGGQYLLIYKDRNTDVSTTLTKELVITEIRISSSSFKASIKPQLTKKPQGYVLVGYQGSYDPTTGPGKTRLGIQVDYQEVNGLQLPLKLNLDAIYDGSPAQMELQFSRYQLKLADSGVSRKSN
jgi:hypothetical protein